MATDQIPGYTIRAMTAAEVDIAVGWAAQEGWNPGHQDAACFRAVDPNGFIGGFLDGALIASISVVAYSPSFAFLGFYVVTGSARGQGHGMALWQQGMAYLGDTRVIGLDGVVEQQANYAKSGFALAYRNIRYGGWVQPETTAQPLDRPDPSTLFAFDRRFFPADRTGFVTDWVTAPGHIAHVVRDGDTVRGYGVLRPCVTGYKVGPLFADTPEIAREILNTLLAEGLPKSGAEVFLDVPEPNAPAVGLAESLSLSPVFETARMYRGPAPDVDLNGVFGVSTFELG